MDSAASFLIGEFYGTAYSETLVMRFICRCCGASYEKAPRVNPNVCSSCEQLLEDDSPETTVASLEKEEQKQKKKAEEPSHKASPKRHSVGSSKR
jgi:hypothetical protein